jgi:hypothetical protein
MHNPQVSDFDTPEDLRALGRDTDRTWREEMAIRESEAELARSKERGLPDVMWEAMQRGDEVAIHVAGRSYRGRLTAVRNDFAVLTTGVARLGVNLKAVDAVQCVRGDGSHGRVGDRTHGSLHAFLTHLEADHRLVRLVGSDAGTDLTARMLAVADDHVLVEDANGAHWAVPLRSLAIVQDLSGG